MLAAGKLRVLSAADADPYPDSIRVDLDEGGADDEGAETSFVSKASRKRKKTAIQKALEKATR